MNSCINRAKRFGIPPYRTGVEIPTAFTLIELLVVIAIIAILASLLLPTLSKAKEKGRSIACQSNLKQLQTCWHLYIDDHFDTLPPNNYIYNISSTNNFAVTGTWCPGNARVDTNTDNIKAGMLFPYNRSTSIYHCPSDFSMVESPSGAKLGMLRTRSYNMSQCANGYGEQEWSPGQQIKYLTPLFERYTFIRNPSPSKFFVFIDEHEDTLFDSMFGFPSTATGYQNYWFDLPANRHNQGCNLSFADGHSEHWQWKVPKIFRDLPQSVAPGEQPDYDRIKSAMRQDFNY